MQIIIINKSLHNRRFPLFLFFLLDILMVLALNLLMFILSLWTTTLTLGIWTTHEMLELWPQRLNRAEFIPDLFSLVHASFIIYRQMDGNVQKWYSPDSDSGGSCSRGLVPCPFLCFLLAFIEVYRRECGKHSLLQSPGQVPRVVVRRRWVMWTFSEIIIRKWM